MRKQFRRIIAGLISSMLILVMISTGVVSVNAMTQADFNNRIAAQQTAYPNGKVCESTQFGDSCFGWAYLIGYNVFGSSPYNWATSYSLSNVKAGDIIQYGNTIGKGHTVFVVNVSGDTITFADCNGNGNGTRYNPTTQRYEWIPDLCKVKWDNTTTISANSLFRYSFSYIKSAPETVTDDISAPTIANARVENVSGSSFTIKCDLSDDVGVTRVWVVLYGPHGEAQFSVPATNGAYSHTINTADYGGPGEYAYAFYAQDAAGNSTKGLVEPIYAINDTVAPTITNARAENVSGSSFTIKCDLYDNVGVTRVWVILYGPHGEAQFSVPASNGAYSHTINTADYGGPGEYAYAFYAQDAAGNSTKGLVEPIYAYNDKIAPIISNARAENISGNSFDIKCDVYDNVGATRAWIIVYGPNGEKQYGISASNGAFSHTVYTAEHGGSGEYAVGFYIFDADDNGTKCVIEPIFAINGPISTLETKRQSYELYNTKVTWKQAKAICEQKGGHLAVINSSEENQALANLSSSLSNYVWIGGTDEDSEGNWHWINGDDFSYTNWYSGEPNNYAEGGGSENYMGLLGRTGLWNDAANDNQYISGFICEYDPDELLGDVDGDGEVSIVDATHIQRYNVQLNITIKEEPLLKCGDIDGDGEVSVVDATFIQRYDTKIETPYPIGKPI